MKRLLALMLVFTAIFCTACSDSGKNTEKTEDSKSVSYSSDNGETESASAEIQSGSEQSDEYISQAKGVFKLYLRSGNAEYDSSMLKLMTASFGEKYKNMKQSMGNDEHYDEEALPLEGLKFAFDDEKCREIEGVNIPEKYDRAVELFVTVLYDNSGEQKTSQQYAIVVEIDGEWKICFAGSQSLAYADGILQNENSKNALKEAKAVYDAAQTAYNELSKDNEYKFQYMNYISTENDKFIDLIKENLDDSLKDSYFTVFMSDGKLSYVVWSKSMGDQVAVTYPESALQE